MCTCVRTVLKTNLKNQFKDFSNDHFNAIMSNAVYLLLFQKKHFSV